MASDKMKDLFNLPTSVVGAKTIKSTPEAITLKGYIHTDVDPDCYLVIDKMGDILFKCLNEELAQSISEMFNSFDELVEERDMLARKLGDKQCGDGLLIQQQISQLTTKDAIIEVAVNGVEDLSDHISGEAGDADDMKKIATELLAQIEAMKGKTE